MADGGMAISSQTVVGTKAANYSGDIRTAESYTADQYSQIEVTSPQLTGGQWLGVGVRAQNSGRNLYLGLYWWNSGSPTLMLFKRVNGNWTQLGSTYNSGPLAAGTQLRLTVTGSTLNFAANGVTRVTATDTTYTSGAPAIMAYDLAHGDNWTADTTRSRPHATPSVVR